MKLKQVMLFALALIFVFMIEAQAQKKIQLKSPNGKTEVTVAAGEKLEWSVKHDGQQIIASSAISLTLEGGKVLGAKPKIFSQKTKEIRSEFKTTNYTKAVVTDEYNLLTLKCKGSYGVEFRVYNDAVAYRFFTSQRGEIIIKNEEANFNFIADYKAYIPYMWDYRDDEKFNSSFEALYTEAPISEFRKDSLSMLPLMVDVGEGKKVVILEDYPGMYLDINSTKKGFVSEFAKFPTEFKIGGYENMNRIPTKRTDYIAKTSGKRNFPWRAIAISQNDYELMDNDIVQKLAAPSRIADESWIKPGKVSWDWWNDWNISHVDFVAGMNTETYKHYIDFASENNLEYIIVDWGWSARFDLKTIVPEMDIKELVAYGKEKNVDIILWACWAAVMEQMEEVFPLYSEMGIKGFKIDFIDRDDQLAVRSTYEIAKIAAENKLLVDYHGVFKPTGLQRTYPNIVNYEGVRGLENLKWANYDSPRYAVSIPYIRMMAGPMDYTPGAMRNASKANFAPIDGNPMSQGTRCHQMAMYVVYLAPLQMLADNPTVYRKEQVCTDFIAKTPVVYDETLPLDGKVAEYLAIARRKSDTWFVAAMTNWDSREIELDFSFLGEGNFEAVIFQDGVNAYKQASDYKKQVVKITSDTKMKVKLAPGGGWVARIQKAE